MKIGLLSLTVVVICIATAHSLPFPYWLDEIQDLSNTKRSLELQAEDGGSGTPPRLRCFICNGNCANEEELETCESGFNCSTVTTLRNGIESKIKVCLPSILCSSDFVCSNVNNDTGDLESCNVDCCHIDECNAEPTYPPSTASSTYPPSTASSTYPPSTAWSTYPPSTAWSTAPPSTASSTYPPSTASSTYPPSTASSTYPPSTASSTYPPSTASSTVPPSTPTTTPAPRTVLLRGNNRMFTIRSPGFNQGSYPPNLDITWVIPERNLRGLTLLFLTIDTERGRDLITIRRGNTVVGTLSGVFRSRGKRSLSIPLYREDSPCDDDDDDDDEVADDVDYFGYDTPYDRLTAGYNRYRRQARGRPPRTPCVYIRARGQQISINFSSDGNDTGQRGFSARLRVYRGRRDDK